MRMKRANITMPLGLIDEAHDLGINVSRVAVKAIEQKVKACKEAEKIE